MLAPRALLARGQRRACLGVSRARPAEGLGRVPAAARAASTKAEELERRYLLGNYSPDGVRSAEGLVFVKGAFSRASLRARARALAAGLRARAAARGVGARSARGRAGCCARA